MRKPKVRRLHPAPDHAGRRIKRLDRVKGGGFSMMITTDLNIDEIAERIRQSSGTLDSEPVDTPWGARMFRLRNPDGFKYTISSQ